MKILSLSGENLASLTGQFTIDFAGGALGAAGLFAITGNTGAGKSTLLDAICLALYDEMPRFIANRKNVAEVGRMDDEEKLKANDVRASSAAATPAVLPRYSFAAVTAASGWPAGRCAGLATAPRGAFRPRSAA